MSELKIVSIQSGAKKDASVETGPFKRGERVHLKSGGPLMTIQKPGKEWSICVWFDEGGCVSDPIEFHNDTLIIYAPKPKPRVRKTYRGKAK